MITKILKFSGSLLLVLTCAGCIKSPIQRPKNLKPLTQETTHDSQTKEQVTVYAKKLSIDDQVDVFGKYAQQQLDKYHIVPVQITIENNSTTCWILADKNITINKLTLAEVNTKLFSARRWRPLWIFLGCLAGTAVVAPLIGIAAGSLLYIAMQPCHGIEILVGYLGAVCYGTYVTAIAAGVLFAATSFVTIIDAVSCHMSHKQMREYLRTCCNAESITLNPDISASMLFFVEESQLPEKLNLLLTDKDLEKHALSFELAI